MDLCVRHQLTRLLTDYGNDTIIMNIPSFLEKQVCLYNSENTLMPSIGAIVS